MPYIAHTYNDWDFKNGYVDPQAAGESGGDIYSGENFVSSESILVAVGPKQFPSDLNQIYSVGVIQNFNMAQNKNIQQLFEIGSRDTILLPGRTFIQATIARIMFNGPSLMKAMYSYSWYDPKYDPNNAPDSPESDIRKQTDYSQTPGIGHLWLNLAATYFNKPMGIALLFHDAEDDIYGGSYLENCLFQAHNLTLASGQTVVAENVALRVGKVVPISVVV